MQLNSLERRMSNIRLVPKVVLLMVFSTLLLLAKLWFDASNLEATLLGEGIDAAKANAIADRLLWTGLMETALMGVVFVVLLLTGSRLMVKQVHYLVGLLERFARKDLSHKVLLKSRDEFGDIAAEQRIDNAIIFIKNENDKRNFYNEDGLYFLMVFHEGKPFSRYNLEITDGNFIYLGYQMSVCRSVAEDVVCRLGFYATQDFIDAQILNREIMGDKIQFYGVAQAVSFKFNTHPFRFDGGLSACR